MDFVKHANTAKDEAESDFFKRRRLFASLIGYSLTEFSQRVIPGVIIGPHDLRSSFLISLRDSESGHNVSLKIEQSGYHDCVVTVTTEQREILATLKYDGREAGRADRLPESVDRLSDLLSADVFDPFLSKRESVVEQRMSSPIPDAVAAIP